MSIIGEMMDLLLAQRCASMGSKGKLAWKSVESRPRKVSPCLKAYALLAISADNGAVRDLSMLD
jgi:dihydroxy-acid dehydratase